MVAVPLYHLQVSVRVCAGKRYISGPGRFKERQQRRFRYKNFALAGNAKCLKSALPNVGSDGRLAYLKEMGRLLYSKQVPGFNIHATFLFSAWYGKLEQRTWSDGARAASF
jgi:hypothetical protein